MKNSRAPRLLSALRWTRSSYYLMSAFILTLGLLTYVWWPLAEEYLALVPWDRDWWRYFDWLLVNIFLFMSLAIMARADLRQDVRMIAVGLAGGLVIESWGTQTEIWTYYTNERPPLWIIPAWPIAGLTIDRLVSALDWATRRSALAMRIRERLPASGWKIAYWAVLLAYFAILIDYAAPTFDKSFTWVAIGLVAFFILTPIDERIALLTFIAGSGLGYYLELWGTTREAWTYYTLARPPLFAVLSHGMAAIAFWRCVRWVDWGLSQLRSLRRSAS